MKGTRGEEWTRYKGLLFMQIYAGLAYKFATGCIFFGFNIV